MIVVIFEVQPAVGKQQEYLDLAAHMRPLLDTIDGFVSIERFQSLTDPNKLLSLSFFESDAAIQQWRNLTLHRAAQSRGRDGVFSDYRLRIAGVVRDYGMFDRQQAPDDSKSALSS